MQASTPFSARWGVPGGNCSVAQGRTVRLTPLNHSARRRVIVNTAKQDSNFDLQTPRGGTSSGQCPFLAGLRTPPTVNLPWLKRAQLQLLNTDKFQAAVFSQVKDDTMVNLPHQPLLGTFYMPATLQMVQDVFAAEGSGTIRQGLGGDSYIFKGFNTMLGKHSLLTVVDPEQHKQLRSLLQPAFNPDAIATYLPVVQDLVLKHLNEWEAAGAEGVKAYEGLKMLTFDFIIQVALGRILPDEGLQHLSKLFEAFTTGLLAWPFLDIPFTPWHRALKAQKELIDYFQSSVTAARQQLAAGGEVPGVMGRLVAAVDEEGNRLTDREICDNMLLLLVAGHDTSSTTLTRCMSNLQDHPAVVQKLRDEQAAVVEQHGQTITAAALKDMVYADAVVRETMRLDPISIAVFRVATCDFDLGGYAVPAGAQLTLPLKYLTEQDPRWVNSTGDMDPALFNPHRMLTPAGSKPGQLMPFGGGVRYCLGAGLAMAEMKVFLALLARGYDFVADNNTEWKPALGYYPANGLPLVLTARK